MIAIDLGSNTIRCIVYDCDTKEWGDDFEAVVRTAEGLHVSNKISDNAVQRIISTLQKADKKLNFSQHSILACTTEAMRRAQNSQDVLEKILFETGVDFQIIDGDQEAFFTTKAVTNRLDILRLTSTSFTLVDIGGGSTEIIFFNGKNLISKSFQIGIVTLYESSKDQTDMYNNLNNLLKPLIEYIQLHYKQFEKPDHFIQTAGTPTTMAAYLQGMTYNTYDASKINGFTLYKDDCSRILNELLSMNDQERTNYVGVGREGLILAGIIIVKRLYEILEYEKAIIIDDSLREGIALSYCENNE